MTTIRDAAFSLLRRHGMTMMFGNPGSNELRFLQDFPTDFRYILGLHEGAVMAMADGYAQASGRAPLVSLHSAAGTGTSMGVLCNTVYSKSPVVVLSGQQVRDTVGQEVMVASHDATLLPRPLSKWSTEPLSSGDVVRSLAQAIHLANLAPKGPTHISVPYDDWDQDAGENPDFVVRRAVTDATALSGAHLAEITASLDAARRPVLVLGSEVDAAHANDDAVRLAERLGAPVWIAPSPPRCPFPTTHPLFQGVLPANVTGVAELLAGHDVVLVVGAPVFRYHHQHPGRYLAEGSRLIHVSDDPSEVARAPFGDAYLAPVADAVARLADSVAARDTPAPARADRAAGTDRPDRMHPDTVFRTISALAPEDAIHVVESTSTAESFWSNVAIRNQGSFYSAAAGALGFGLPAAVGVQLARPGRRVVATIGDGSANFGLAGLWTAARYQVPVTFVILRNGTYGALDGFGRRLSATGLPGFELPDIDFVSLAKGYGVRAETVSTQQDFRDALTKAFAADEPVLVEAQTFYP
jgi:benzoylformate decarboxylase